MMPKKQGAVQGCSTQRIEKLFQLQNDQIQCVKC